jgi:hypothetical protein
VNTLTNLVDLRLTPASCCCIAGSMLAGPRNLTRLDVCSYDEADCIVEPEALAGKTNMQHLSLLECNKSMDAQEYMQLLAQLQQMQQLTHLDLQETLTATLEPAPFSALTASSKLQYLCVQLCTVWHLHFSLALQTCQAWETL